MTLAELNAAGRDAFTDAIGWVFEQSPWVAGRAWEQRPFASLDALHAAMTGEVARASRDEQLALLRAHPDLGSRVQMSDASVGEQAGAGLDRLASADFVQMRRANDAYRLRFGFPFLLAVKGCTAAQVLESLSTRIEAMPDEEFAEALRQVARIARFRLEDILSA